MVQQQSRGWSFAYNTMLYVSSALSAAAAVMLKIEVAKAYANDASAICAAVAALLTTLIAGGGFSRKWRTNRIARGKISQLLIDVDDPGSDLGKIRNQLKQVINDEDEAIIGPG